MGRVKRSGSMSMINYSKLELVLSRIVELMEEESEKGSLPTTKDGLKVWLSMKASQNEHVIYSDPQFVLAALKSLQKLNGNSNDDLKFECTVPVSVSFDVGIQDEDLGKYAKHHFQANNLFIYNICRSFSADRKRDESLSPTLCTLENITATLKENWSDNIRIAKQAFEEKRHSVTDMLCKKFFEVEMVHREQLMEITFNDVLHNLQNIEYLSTQENGAILYNHNEQFYLFCMESLVRNYTEHKWNMKATIKKMNRDIRQLKKSRAETAKNRRKRKQLESAVTVLHGGRKRRRNTSQNDSDSEGCDYSDDEEVGRHRYRGRKRRRYTSHSDSDSESCDNSDYEEVRRYPSSKQASWLDALCVQLKNIDVAGIQEIPKDLTFPSAVLLMRLVNMDDSRPKTVKALRNIFMNTCKMCYIWDVRDLHDQCLPLEVTPADSHQPNGVNQEEMERTPPQISLKGMKRMQIVLNEIDVCRLTDKDKHQSVKAHRHQRINQKNQAHGHQRIEDHKTVEVILPNGNRYISSGDLPLYGNEVMSFLYKKAVDYAFHGEDETKCNFVTKNDVLGQLQSAEKVYTYVQAVKAQIQDAKLAQRPNVPPVASITNTENLVSDGHAQLQQKEQTFDDRNMEMETEVSDTSHMANTGNVLQEHQSSATSVCKTDTPIPLLGDILQDLPKLFTVKTDAFQADEMIRALQAKNIISVDDSDTVSFHKDSYDKESKEDLYVYSVDHFQ